MKHFKLASWPSTFLLLLLTKTTDISARPLILQEQKQGHYQSLLKGAYVGFETLLSLMGYYEDENVKSSLSDETLNINPKEHEDDRTKIKVVGLGLGRTGTTSLAMALEILGYSVFHDDEQTENTDVYAALEREDIDLDEMHEIFGLRGYNATFKSAGCEWAAEQNEIKAILTVRDNADKYVDSWLVAAPFYEIMEKRPFVWMSTVSELMPSLEAEYKYETTDDEPQNFLNREVLRKTYEGYIEWVQEEIPSERLLTFNVKQGWGPLCEYLGHPIPEGVPFPHVHTRAKLLGEMYFLRLITWIWPLVFLLPLLISIVLLRRLK